MQICHTHLICHDQRMHTMPSFATPDECSSVRGHCIQTGVSPGSHFLTRLEGRSNTCASCRVGGYGMQGKPEGKGDYGCGMKGKLEGRGDDSDTQTRTGPSNMCWTRAHFMTGEFAVLLLIKALVGGPQRVFIFAGSIFGGEMRPFNLRPHPEILDLHHLQPVQHMGEER